MAIEAGRHAAAATSRKDPLLAANQQLLLPLLIADIAAATTRARNDLSGKLASKLFNRAGAGAQLSRVEITKVRQLRHLSIVPPQL